MNNTWRCLSSGFVLLLLAGCASPSADKAAANEDEYIYVTVTGSNIPKRIKRSALATDDLPKDGDMQVIDKEQFMRSLPTSKKVDRGGG